MKKDRLDWIMSGLNQYQLTDREDQFIKSVEEEFREKNMISEAQEERLEALYREKSKMIPNKTYFVPRESKNAVKKPKRLQGKIIP